jgi:hypothetical protein
VIRTRTTSIGRLPACTVSGVAVAKRRIGTSRHLWSARWISRRTHRHANTKTGRDGPDRVEDLMSKQRREQSQDSIFVDNPFVDGFLEWMGSREGGQCIEVRDVLWDLLVRLSESYDSGLCGGMKVCGSPAVTKHGSRISSVVAFRIGS